MSLPRASGAQGAPRPAGEGRVEAAHSADGPTRRRRALSVLLAINVLACWLLVALGDTVRVTESGMGCRSWPLCNGSAGLGGSYHALLEQSHRYGAAIVTALVLASFWALRRRRAGNPLALRAAGAAVGLIGLQIAFGAITVVSHNAGWTVALHLTGAWLLLAAVTIAAVGFIGGGAPRAAPSVEVSPGAAPAPGFAPRRIGGRKLRSGPVVAAIAVLLVAVSGMFVLHGQASDACRSWPLCLGSTAPPRLLLLQYLHRAFGLAAAAAVIVCALAAWRSGLPRSADRIAAAVALALLAVTAALGGLVAVTGAPEWAQGLHLALASALWADVVAIAVLQALNTVPMEPAPASTQRRAGPLAAAG